MPKAISITKEMIVNAAFDIVRHNGFNSLSARMVAKKIGCSTQPIYWTYKNMDDLKQDVISKTIDFLNEKVRTYRKTDQPFLDLGMGYIHAAHTEPILFQAMYVENIRKLKVKSLTPSEAMYRAMEQDECYKDVQGEEQKFEASRAWVFAHGIASLVSSGMMIYDEEFIEKLLLSIPKN